MSNKFIYKNLITASGVNPYLYKDDEGIYALVTNSANGSVWIDMYISYDDGESWFTESYLPPDTLKLYDAKMVSIGKSKYIFAHGYNQWGVDTIRYIRYEPYEGNEEVYAWEDEWHDFFSEYLLHARITDITVDDSQNYIHVTYDKATAHGTYGVYYAIYSPTTNSIVFNKAIYSHPAYNQNNAKLIQSGSNTFSICWEEENVYKKNQIMYATFDSLTNSFSNPMELSMTKDDDKHKSHYHPSMAIDSYSNIHIAWLRTTDSYDTSYIQYMNITNDTPSTVQTLSEISENNKYPFMMCDENDNLYILYNFVKQNEKRALQTYNYTQLNIRYWVKKYDSTEWTQITDLTENNWNILTGWCSDKNIYSLIVENNNLYFLRIDTNIAEVFAPVSDLKIDSITNSTISLSWTKARNAENIFLQRLNDDNYIDATLVEPLSVNDTWAIALELEKGIYKFRIKYTLDDGTENVQYIDKTFNINTDEFKVSWEPIDNIISQTLQYTKETWSNLDDAIISNSDSSISYNFSKSITRYRLNIIGGVAEGYSNEVKPLVIELDENSNIKLTWSKLNDILTLAVQESMDGINWYKAQTKEIIGPDSTSCTIENLNDVVYVYRLIYRNEAQTLLTSNEVSMVNNLKLVNVTFNSVILHWNDITANEGKFFQYSLNHGISWENVLYPINNNLTNIPSLKHDTEYLFRIFFPNRYTGNYSNILTVTTMKKPIDDLIVLKQTNTSVTCQFTIDDDYSDIDVILYSAADDMRTFKLSDIEHTKTDIIVNETWVGYKIIFVIDWLSKGNHYNIGVEPLESSRGDLSNLLDIYTNGDGIESLEPIEITPHSVTLQFGELNKIDENTIQDYAAIFYSYDDVNYSYIMVDTVNQYKLENLMQNTKYYIYMECYYGDNYGKSPKIEIVTAEDKFDALKGQRLPGERCFCKTHDAFYVFDKGILYKVTEDNQEIVYDYKISSNHVYAAIDVDQNDNLHLVFSYNKHIYYATNCLLSDGTNSDIKEPILIAMNRYANELMFPDIKVTYDNRALIVYEENFGYNSRITYCAYKNKEKIANPTVYLDDNSLNVCPKLALKNSHSENKGMNGFFIVTISNDNKLKLMSFNADCDKDSSTYKDELISTVKFDLKDNLVGIYNELSIESDNLDKPHICYYSYNNNDRSMTYAVIEGEEISQFAFYRCQTARVIPSECFVTIIEQDNQLYSSKFSVSQSTFTDRMLLNDKLLELDNFVNIIHDDENIYILSFENGLFLIQTFNMSDIEESNNYINNNWIDNEFSIEDDECTITVWTDGDIHNYPLMYVKINSLVSDITPRDQYGNILNKSITVNSFEKDENSEFTYILTYNNDQTKVITAKDRLVYDWDKDTIINENS